MGIMHFHMMVSGFPELFDLMLLHFPLLTILKLSKKSPYHQVGFKGMVMGRMRHEIIGLKEMS